MNTLRGLNFRPPLSPVRSVKSLVSRKKMSSPHCSISISSITTRASISSLCQKISWTGMSGLCSRGSFELIPSVCTSLPKTGAREESGDTHYALQHPDSWPNHGWHPVLFHLSFEESCKGRQAKGQTQKKKRPRRGQLVASTKASSGLGRLQG